MVEAYAHTNRSAYIGLPFPPGETFSDPCESDEAQLSGFGHGQAWCAEQTGSASSMLSAIAP